MWMEHSLGFCWLQLEAILFAMLILMTSCFLKSTAYSKRSRGLSLIMSTTYRGYEEQINVYEDVGLPVELAHLKRFASLVL